MPEQGAGCAHLPTLEAGLRQNCSRFISLSGVSMRAYACFGAPPPPSYTVVGLSLKASQSPMPILLTDTSLLGAALGPELTESEKWLEQALNSLSCPCPLNLPRFKVPAGFQTYCQ